MSEEHSSSMNEVEEQAEYYQNLQSPSYELQKDLFVNQRKHQIDKLQRIMKEDPYYSKQLFAHESFQGKSFKKDVYSLLSPLQIQDQFQQYQSQEESSSEQQGEGLLYYKNEEKNLLDQILLPFSMVQGKCYYELHPEIFKSKDLMKTFEQDSNNHSQEINEPAQNEIDQEQKHVLLNKQMKDLLKLINSYQSFSQILEIAMNFHTIRYGQHLPKIYESMFWILKKQGEKMENGLEEEVNCLKYKMSRQQSAEEIYDFNPFTENFNNQKLNNLDEIHQSISQNSYEKRNDKDECIILQKQELQ